MEFKLPKAKKTKWLKALRSGKFIQATGQLKIRDENNEHGHCCLGVARAVRLCKAQGSSGDDACYVSESFLPQRIQDTLINFNDDQGLSFRVIAQWIDDNL
jgi:hypothetical protein